MSAPCASSASRWPTRSTPTTKPKAPARPAATPASASSNTAASARADAERLGGGEEHVGRGLAGELPLGGDPAVDRGVEQVGDARPRRAPRGFALDDTTAVRSPGGPHRPT